MTPSPLDPPRLHAAAEAFGRMISARLIEFSEASNALRLAAIDAGYIDTLDDIGARLDRTLADAADRAAREAADAVQVATHRMLSVRACKRAIIAEGLHVAAGRLSPGEVERIAGAEVRAFVTKTGGARRVG